MSEIRTRFAPSPTGYLHVGGLRTALYNYLYARRHAGKFILRIEDTDQSRKVEGAMENLIETLHWAGVDFDEGPGREGEYGPYIQSQRLTLYQRYAHQLVEEDNAYYCFCTPERLDEVRQKQVAAKLPPSYDRHCRSLTKEESFARRKRGETFVIRMKVPLTGELTFADLIRGKVTIAHKILDDQVLLKSDGYPTYHLAVVVDDHHMKISHVIRGEEWLPSTPKHIILYRFFGWDMPEFAHLPLLLNPDKSKLSKRQGDVAVEDYRSKGYLREAIVNFIAFLGWNPGDNREILTIDELVKEFTIERVGKSGAIFNIEKLNWLNEQHIRRKSDEELLSAIRPMLAERGWAGFSDEYITRVIDLMKERVTVIPDFIGLCAFFYEDPVAFDEKGRAKNWSAGTGGLLRDLSEKLAQIEPFSAAAVEEALRSEAAKQNLNAAQLIHPLRLALTGITLGPSLFHLVEIIGRETTLRRIDQAITKLG